MKKLLAAIILAAALAPLSGVYAATNPQSLPPPVIFFSADPERVTLGEATVFSWNALYATSCRASGPSARRAGGWSGDKPTLGSEFIRPGLPTGGIDETEEYRLSCRGPGGSTTEEIEISIRVKRGQPALLFTATPRTIEPGRSVRFEWDSPNADTCVASGGTGRNWNGVKNTSGTLTVRPTDTARYELACGNEFGTTTERLTVVVNNPAPPATLFLPLTAVCSVYPPAVRPNELVTFAASATGGSPPYTYRWSGARLPDGQAVERAGIIQTLAFAETGIKNVELAITDASGETAGATCSVEVTLTPPLFVQQKADQSPTGGTAGRPAPARLKGADRENRVSPVLDIFQENIQPPLAAIGTLAVGFAKIVGWALLVVFNVLLLALLAYLLFQIRKEYRALRQVDLDRFDLDEVVASISR